MGETKQMTVADIKTKIYKRDKNVTALMVYTEISDPVSDLIAKHWQKEEWETLEELQAHMENLLMDCVDEIEAQEQEAGKQIVFKTLFVKYDYNNKYNISVSDIDTQVTLFKGRVKSLDNIKKLRKLGYFERRSNL